MSDVLHLAGITKTYNNGKRKKRTRVHNRVSDFKLPEREN